MRDNSLVTGLAGNPPQSWKCCVEYSKNGTYFLSFLKSVFSDHDKQRKYVQENSIITEKETPDRANMYSVLYKREKNSSRIIPVYLYPMPCDNETCMYNVNYSKHLVQAHTDKNDA